MVEGTAQSVEYVEQILIGFRSILGKAFIENKVRINATVVLHAIKTKEFDKNTLLDIIFNLPKEEWNLKLVIEKLKECNAIMGISDEYLKKTAVHNVNTNELKELKWSIIVEMMLEYAKFTKEFYDMLKYSEVPNMPREKHMLMLEIMQTLKYIHMNANDIYERFNGKKISSQKLGGVTQRRLIIEALLLRIYHILLHIKERSLWVHYHDVLARERIGYTYQKTR